ncbi:helix-turn-helix transcriptional regulator [Paenibacillus wenxiniae]|uniref:Helix-turn-helix transcriptional regulator n=1 Tax=Paenibacillus wenxiniae TaxID=1636843 RepID=A0ABW4RCG7_9BACL
MILTMKQARMLADKKQKEIAEVMGVHPQTYGKWEKNPDLITIGEAKQFCELVGVDFESIFFSSESNLIRQK